MRTIALIRQLTISIAILAMLMLQLAPAISGVILSDAVTDADAICSTSKNSSSKIANRLSPLSQPTTDFPRKTPLHFTHCHYCFTHAGSFALPISATIVAPLVRAHFHYPTAFYQSSLPLFAWSPAQPRAPPISISIRQTS
ncbi:DUF2946 domain-containing protein [Undibacterium sp. RuRC25W]|uniref:DUF2946 domain-containing protein n=1 Tax=Undibacterium sp. RuRC25W TaxID=3413047 RepID=UPI003BF433BB